MRYALLVYETQAGVSGRDDPEYQAAYKAYIKAIYEQGVAIGGSGLQDAATTATTFRLVAGERQIQDGPFADTKDKSPEYLALNPNGAVPTLVDGDWVLTESRAITQYLASRQPESGLLPRDDGSRGARPVQARRGTPGRGRSRGNPLRVSGHAPAPTGVCFRTGGTGVGASAI